MDPVTAFDDGPHRTVGEVAALLGVTVRTLHHWDDLGLAVPSRRSEAGYRSYSPADVDRLRRVLLHRELGLGLDDIRTLLDEHGTDPSAVLSARREELREHVERLRRLDDDLGRMVDAHERGVTLPAEQQRALFGAGWDPAWPEQARARWGDGTAWRQYAERAAGRDAEDWRAAADRSAAFERALVAAMDDGVEPGSPAADALVDEHRAVFSTWFPLSRTRQVLLARTYTDDPGFRAHHEDLRPGLADWFRAVVEDSARRHGVDPDTAVWE